MINNASDDALGKLPMLCDDAAQLAMVNLQDLRFGFEHGELSGRPRLMHQFENVRAEKPRHNEFANVMQQRRCEGFGRKGHLNVRLDDFGYKGGSDGMTDGRHRARLT